MTPERAAELTREANKLQHDLLTLLDVAGVSPLVKPIVAGIIGRLQYVLVSILQEIKRP